METKIVQRLTLDCPLCGVTIQPGVQHACESKDGGSCKMFYGSIEATVESLDRAITATIGKRKPRKRVRKAEANG